MYGFFLFGSHVMFGRGVYSHLVTVATEKQLLVWNLVTCSTLWMLNVRVAIMVQDDASGVQAVFSTDRDCKHDLLLVQDFNKLFLVVL